METHPYVISMILLSIRCSLINLTRLNNRYYGDKHQMGPWPYPRITLFRPDQLYNEFARQQKFHNPHYLGDGGLLTSEADDEILTPNNPSDDQVVEDDSADKNNEEAYESSHEATIQNDSDSNAPNMPAHQLPISNENVSSSNQYLPLPAKDTNGRENTTQKRANEVSSKISPAFARSWKKSCMCRRHSWS